LPVEVAHDADVAADDSKQDAPEQQVEQPAADQPVIGLYLSVFSSLYRP